MAVPASKCGGGGKQEKILGGSKVKKMCAHLLFLQFYAEIVRFGLMLTHLPFFFFFCGGGGNWGKKIVFEENASGPTTA